jgi:hypothetical protein
MQRLMAVEEAKELMAAATDWSIWRWLTEKRRVREAADRGTDALYDAEKKVKGGWCDDLQKAYRELEAKATFQQNPKTKRQLEKAVEEARQVDAKIKAAAQRVKEADDLSEEARLQAEATFDEAERRLSAGLAREGALQAIDAFELHEKAIRKAEVAARIG